MAAEEDVSPENFLHRIRQIGASLNQNAVKKNFHRLKKDYNTTSTEKTIHITKNIFRIHADSFSLDDMQSVKEAIFSIESNIGELLDSDQGVFSRFFQALFPGLKKKIHDKVQGDLEDTKTFIELQKRNLVDSEFNRYAESGVVPENVLHLLSFFPKQTREAKKEQIVESLHKFSEKQQRHYVEGIASSLGINFSKMFAKAVEEHRNHILKDRRDYPDTLRMLLADHKVLMGLENALKDALNRYDPCERVDTLISQLQQLAEKLHRTFDPLTRLPILHILVVVAGKNPRDGFIVKLINIDAKALTKVRDKESKADVELRVQVYDDICSLIKSIVGKF